MRADRSPSLEEIAERITADLVHEWTQHRQQGTTACIGPLEEALPALARVNARYQGRPLLETLGRQLSSPLPGVRQNAIGALNCIGAAAADQADLAAVLVERLKERRRETREEAAEALGRIVAGGPCPDSILRALLKTLKTDEMTVRVAAARALTRLVAAAEGSDMRWTIERSISGDDRARYALEVAAGAARRIDTPPGIESGPNLLPSSTLRNAFTPARALQLYESLQDASPLRRAHAAAGLAAAMQTGIRIQRRGGRLEAVTAEQLRREAIRSRR